MMKKIATLENADEARLLDSILSEWDIPHMIRSYYDTAFNGLYQTQKGWGYVSAPFEFEEEVMKIIADLRNSESCL
ncbi:MAG: hypothetical protein JW882_20590 [Deltaproteobacteria bacterium]|nr:hypothetical protein [Deltaproteobacteria bacterium]